MRRISVVYRGGELPAWLRRRAVIVEVDLVDVIELADAAGWQVYVETITEFQCEPDVARIGLTVEDDQAAGMVVAVAVAPDAKVV